MLEFLEALPHSAAMFRKDPRITTALAEWHEIAPDLGLNPSAFRAKLLWQKEESNRSHIVLRLASPDRKLVLKRIFKPSNNSRTRESLAMQQRAAQAMAGLDGLLVPQVLHVSPDGALGIMQHVPGKTLNDHLEAGKPAEIMLRRAGKWLGAFHGAFETSQRTYQPQFMVRHMARVSATVEADMTSLPERDLFLRCAERIPAIADRFTGQRTVSAQKYGDLNLRNILIGPDGVAGLDLAPDSSAPVGFDIARLLMDYAELFQPPGDPVRGSLLSEATLEAFFQGYRLVGMDDPAVGFLPYVQILNDWRIIPVRDQDRSLRQSRRLAMILHLAEHAFLK